MSASEAADRIVATLFQGPGPILLRGTPPTEAEVHDSSAHTQRPERM